MDRLPISDLHHILDHTRDIWDDLRGARLFITGGTGFFGHWIMESFQYVNQQLDLKASASILTRDPDSAPTLFSQLVSDPAISFIKGDVRTFDFPQCKYSHIIHAATDASAKLNEENPILMLDTIIAGTHHTLDFALHCKADKFLLTSSGAVYGKQPSDTPYLPEDYNGAPDPLDPKSAYGLGKRTAEHLCTLYAKQHGLHISLARCFAFVGPHLPLDTHFAIGNFIRDTLHGLPIVIKGDGTPYRSYLYAADLTIWLWTILLRGKSCRPYNVGSDETLTIAQLAQVVAEQFGPNIAITTASSRDPQKAPERYVPSISRAREELKLDTWISLLEGIQKTSAFYRNKIR